MIELVARPAADAFVEVTVFVATMIGLFGYLQLRFGDRLTRFLASRWRAGPLLGAMVGVIPGCGGAILAMPLYAQRQVSFGTVVAALVATMGDSSFVIMAADPGLALVLHVVLFVTGAITGFIVDAIGLAPRPRHAPDERRAADEPRTTDASRAAAVPVAVGEPRAADEPRDADVLIAASTGHAATAWMPDPSRQATTGCTAGLVDDGPTGPVGATSGRPAGSVGLPSGGPGGSFGAPSGGRPSGVRRLGARSTAELWPMAFWVLIALGAMLVVPDLLRGVTPGADDPARGVDVTLLVGLAGTATAAVLATTEARARRRRQPRREVTEVVDVLRTSAVESARIAVWVGVAFLGMELVAELGVSVIAMASVAGMGGVLVGAGLGLLPGCAPQIVLTGLYASGGLPFPTLLANALSQDGDALLPMLLMERRAAVVASLVTTVPGLLAGSLVLLLRLSP